MWPESRFWSFVCSVISALAIVIAGIGIQRAFAAEPVEVRIAQRCMYVAISAEAIQTIRNGGYDYVTGDAVDPVPTYDQFTKAVKPLAEGNPVRKRDMDDLGAWVYTNIPDGLDPVNAAFIAGNNCIQQSMRFHKPPDVDPPKESSHGKTSP